MRRGEGGLEVREPLDALRNTLGAHKKRFLVAADHKLPRGITRVVPARLRRGHRRGADVRRVLEVGLSEIDLPMEFHFLPHYVERPVDEHVGEEEKHKGLVGLSAAFEELATVQEIAVCIT